VGASAHHQDRQLGVQQHALRLAAEQHGRDTAAPDSGPAPDTSPPGADTSGPAADSAAPLPRAGRRATPTPSGCICGTPSNATPANGAGVAAALALLAALGARRRRR